MFNVGIVWHEYFKLNIFFYKDDRTFKNFFKYAHLENTSSDMPSDLYLIYMVSRNSMPIVKYYGAKIEVGLEPV